VILKVISPPSIGLMEASSAKQMASVWFGGIPSAKRLYVVTPKVVPQDEE
jgi:hypothetical protein